MAGVIGNPVSNKGLLLEDPSTFSTANKNGIYGINYNSNGISVDTGLTDGVVKWGVLIHMGGTFASQILVNGINPLKYFVRGRSDTGWKTWQRIDNFGYNTLEELASGVAGQIGVQKKNALSLMPAGSFGYLNHTTSVRLFTTVAVQTSLGCMVMYAASTGSVAPNFVLITVGKDASNSTLSVRCKYLMGGTATLPIKYKINSDKSVSVYIMRTEYTPVYSAMMFGNGYSEGLMTMVDNTELEGAFDASIV